MKEKGKTLFINIKGLVLAEKGPSQVKRGKEMCKASVLHNSFLELKDGHISSFGSMAALTDIPNNAIDVSGRYILPTWCDSHTHIVYASSREKEFVMRIQGKSYEAIAAEGGGILNSARKLSETPEEQLLESAIQRLDEVIQYGTGAIEIKSGYGLSFEAEMKMLRVIQQLKSISPIPIKSTFLGAHAIPASYKANRKGYINLIKEKMLPHVAEHGLAEYCDVFCDKGFFTPDETIEILKCASKYGLKGKIHANELGITGGVQAGISAAALSVDHLECISSVEIEALLNSQTLPTLLPSCAFFLNIPYAPARKMIDEGLPVVLATDYNPGSTPSGNMSFVISLACIKMKMLPEEAISAATINGAFAMELQNEVGSIQIGKRANLIISKPIESLARIPYSFGSDLIEKVYVNGATYKGL